MLPRMPSVPAERACSACVPACPVQAILPEDEAEQKWIDVNTNFAYEEDTRRTSQDQVTHGPDYDPDKA